MTDECFCVSPEQSFHCLAAGSHRWPCPFEKLSVSYSDDPNLVGRARAIVKIQNDLNSRMYGQSQEDKISQDKCIAQPQSQKFTCTNSEWSQKVAVWQQFMWKGFGSTREAVR